MEYFISCIQNGQLDKCKEIIQSDEKFYNNEAFQTSCEYGHLEISQWLLEFNPDIIKNDKDNQYGFTYNTFSQCCENGHLEVSQWLLQLKPDIDISHEDEYTFRHCCENGHLEICKWLLDIKPTINVHTLEEYAFRFSCENGHLDVSQWLLKLYPEIDMTILEDYAFRKSCENGHLDMSQWLLRINPSFNITVRNYYALRLSCENGHLDMMQWLYHLNPTTRQAMNITEYKVYKEMFLCSCENGHLDICTWLFDIAPSYRKDGLYKCVDDFIFLKNIQKGNVKMCQWILKLTPSKIDIIRNKNDFIFRSCCLLQQKEMTIWLMTLCSHYNYEVNELGDMKPVINRDAYECCVCYLNSNCVTECNHVVCESCFKQLHKSACPICRRIVKVLYH